MKKTGWVRDKNSQQAGLTLALGGGGRGFAHVVGVLEALEQQGARVEAIVGTSSGAIAGAGYALGYSLQQMRQRILEFTRSHLAQDPRIKALMNQREEQICFRLGDRVGCLFCQGRIVNKSLLLGSSVFEPGFMRDMIAFFLPDVAIESTRIPFAAVTTDVQSGQTVVIDQGPFARRCWPARRCLVWRPCWSARGACSWTAAWPPWCLPWRPASAAPAGSWPYALDRELASQKSPRQALELYLRAGDIQSALLSQLVLREADVVVRQAVGAVHWMEFSKAPLVMELGGEATQRLLLDDSWRRRLTLAWRAGCSALESAAHWGQA